MWNTKKSQKNVQKEKKNCPAETNIAAENRPSQKETSISTIRFQVQTCC